MKFKNAKVGDEVYSLKFGNGNVTHIGSAISVKFKNETVNFDLDGVYYPTDVTPDLYWSKPEIIEPKRKVEKTIDVFINWYGEGNYAFHNSMDSAKKYADTIRNPQTTPAKITFTIEE